MKQIVCLLLLLLGFQAQAQFPTLSEDAEVSLITIGPGKYLYDCFGHSAFRIKDPALGLDRAYNYGSYDSFEEGFYVNFSMGTADYKLDARDFDRFLYVYEYQNRWVKEQVLDITSEEKQAIFNFLETNRQPENMYYRYDQFYDNCATKLRDVVKDVLGDKLVFHDDFLTEEATLRDLVDENAFNHPWWDLGIDIGLGNLVDKKASVEDRMYLPDYVHSAYEHATITRNGSERPAIKYARDLNTTDFYEQRKDTLDPWIVFTVLSILVIALTLRDYLKKQRSRAVDFSIFFVTGLVGTLVVFLWFGTHHTTTVNNMNILWAFMPNIVVAFFLLKRTPPVWTRVYSRFLVILLLAMAIVWITRFQVFNIGMLPLMVMFAFRYVFLWQQGLARK